MPAGKSSKILLKLTGEIFSPSNLAQNLAAQLAIQIKNLITTHQFAVVIGGGNLFRGPQQKGREQITASGQVLPIKPTSGHQIGMLATLMNAIVLRDIFQASGLECRILSALNCPAVAAAISPAAIADNLQLNRCLIFAGGTGEPFFSTDTAAVLRALQIEATAVWKASTIDGIYNADPQHDSQAKRLAQISYQTAIEQNLKILDRTAILLAQAHALPVRVFAVTAPDALLQAARNPDFGSRLN